MCKVLNTLLQELAGIAKKEKLRRMYKEHLHSRSQHPYKFTQTKGSVYIKEKKSTPRGLLWNTNMAAVSLFWNTNRDTVTSCENALYTVEPW